MILSRLEESVYTIFSVTFSLCYYRWVVPVLRHPLFRAAAVLEAAVTLHCKLSLWAQLLVLAFLPHDYWSDYSTRGAGVSDVIKFMCNNITVVHSQKRAGISLVPQTRLAYVAAELICLGVQLTGRYAWSLQPYHLWQNEHWVYLQLDSAVKILFEIFFL